MTVAHLTEKATKPKPPRTRRLTAGIAYPSTAQISRVVRAAQAAGVVVGNVEVGRDGAIRVSEAPRENKSSDEFEMWQDRL